MLSSIIIKPCLETGSNSGLLTLIMSSHSQRKKILELAVYLLHLEKLVKGNKKKIILLSGENIRKLSS